MAETFRCKLLIFLFLLRETQETGTSSTEKHSATRDENTAKDDATQPRKSPSITYTNLNLVLLTLDKKPELKKSAILSYNQMDFLK